MNPNRQSVVFPRESAYVRTLDLLLMVEDACDDNILECLASIQTEPLRDGFDSLWSEVTLGVHIYNLNGFVGTENGTEINAIRVVFAAGNVSKTDYH